ncbi:hypothetical protein Anas_07460 [Armadillidium nasatum]|uniref:Uncharacterized protein n=1 Tax=Armadillidium nasatum TaxID=96803 RepID=A0A5N5SM50_9CRUS|nr:hypothetical protein Anas_07460 [Armadillidium nasatum]
MMIENLRKLFTLFYFGNFVSTLQMDSEVRINDVQTSLTSTVVRKKFLSSLILWTLIKPLSICNVRHLTTVVKTNIKYNKAGLHIPTYLTI